METALNPTTEAAQRWWRWMRNRRDVVCALGHHYRDQYRFTEHGAVRCTHWIHGERRKCSRWTYLIALKGGGAIAVDVTQQDVDEIEKLSTTNEIIEYLGIFP